MLALAACTGEPGEPDQPLETSPPSLGALEVITAHSGPATDPDGYTLVIGGVEFGRLGVADTLLVRNLPEAEYRVGLAGVADHCDNGGANPRDVVVAGGATTRVIFAVKCALRS